MRIDFEFGKEFYKFNQDNKDEERKLNFVLSNHNGDFFQHSIKNKNPIEKFFGLYYCDKNNLELFKVLDEFILPNLEVKRVSYQGFRVLREFKSSLEIIEGEDNETLEVNNSKLDENGRFISNDDVSSLIKNTNTYDIFYLSPKGGLVYEIYNYDGELIIDLDPRKQDDFDKWGREIETYKKNDVLFIKYVKKQGEDENYSILIGIKAPNFNYTFEKEWIKKEYSYSKLRNSLSEWYVYRLLRTDIFESKRIIIGYGKTEEEVLEKISLNELNQLELENFEKEFIDDLIAKDVNFKKPVMENSLISYNLANYSLYKFLSNFDCGDLKEGVYAGFPWFSQVWTRDELFSLRAFINNGEYRLVRDKIFYYLDKIDENGEIPVINCKDGSINSIDGVFWLGKRIDDFIFKLNENEVLDKYLTLGELEYIYDTLKETFRNIIKTHWDREKELLRVGRAVSWMDTIDENNYPLDIQVQFLNFVSTISILGDLLNKKREISEFLDFEILLKTKIINTYFKNGYLYNDEENKTFNINVFLSYYFFPDLLFREDWGKVFDKAILKMFNNGLFSSISKSDKRFKGFHTGEDNLSYHQGDSWYFMNNLAAICLFDLNEKKYRKEILKIIKASTNDILRFGTIGFGSEISSANRQEAVGCFAQCWSSASFVEMIDKIFERE